MKRAAFPPADLLVRPHELWSRRWLLLAAGSLEKNDFNAMTVGWGSFGTMWNKPFAQIVVRPTRHTFAFLEKYPTFTLSAFTEEQRPALQLMGSRSGRDCDKIAESGLHVEPSAKVDAPSFTEAELVIECRTIYRADFDPAAFGDLSIDRNYPKKDYHRSYFGEIVAASAVPRHYR